ncbi:hypothetical protein AM1_A0065 (plasmid) [Acaryochloris marina MBIC11017]|uniref:Uncharacterized protein n=1 Tax=Acaryochloris marina (strain MBIC 11017) TaxID=329726 RepID=A8ZK74_ACAM1|nr:hypothetical protein AM1_A0065 [Acaryochloris marina MBIC11017]
MIHATMNRYAFQTILQSKYLRQTQDGQAMIITLRVVLE